MNAKRYIIQQMFGDSAIVGSAKLYMANRSGVTSCEVDPELSPVMVGGVIMMDGSPLPEDGEGMLECEVIIIPKRLHQGNSFNGYRLDQILTGGYEKPEKYSTVKTFSSD